MFNLGLAKSRMGHSGGNAANPRQINISDLSPLCVSIGDRSDDDEKS